MAALWDLDWSGPAPSAKTDAYEMPKMRVHSPPKVRVNSKTFVRLAQLPDHKQGQLQRFFPAADFGRLSKSGGIRGAAAKDLIASAPELEEKLGRRSQLSKKGSMRTMEEGSLVRVFKWLDMNGDGYVDVSELYAGQHALGGHLNREQCADLLWEVDDDMDGRLTMDDFIDAFYRSQKDVTGFEPRRFYFMVEFFLMDRDLSGEITIDEAMSTIFQRYGAAGLGKITRDFFAAAGYSQAEGEPPPGAIVTFDAFFDKFAMCHPKVRSPQQLGSSYSLKVLPVIHAAENQRRERIESTRKSRSPEPSGGNRDSFGRKGGGRAATAPSENDRRGRKKVAEPFWAPSWDGGVQRKSPPRGATAGRRGSPERSSKRLGKSKSAAILDGMLKPPSAAPIGHKATAPVRPTMV